MNDTKKPQTVKEPAKLRPYEFTDTLEALDAGIFAQKLSHAIHQCAAAVRDFGKPGKVTVEFGFKQIGDGAHLMCAHKLKYEKPTARGKVGEEDVTETPLWVSRKGLTLIPDRQERFDFDQD